MSFPAPSDVVIGYLVGHITPTGKQFVPYAVYPTKDEAREVYDTVRERSPQLTYVLEPVGR